VGGCVLKIDLDVAAARRFASAWELGKLFLAKRYRHRTQEDRDA
jgi:hypothetical protein